MGFGRQPCVDELVWNETGQRLQEFGGTGWRKSDLHLMLLPQLTSIVARLRTITIWEPYFLGFTHLRRNS
jgi:hypothetical protein